MELFHPTENIRKIAARVGALTIAGLEAVDNSMNVWDEVETQIPGINIESTNEDHLLRGEE